MNRPIDVVDETDRGDDVVRRFRFQIGYVALKAISLLGADCIAICIYCEHHEDVLIELANGKFIGTQIKTREVGLSPFKSTDEQILSTLVRFCKEDAAYPDQFEGFCLATNTVFFKGDGADDLRNLIECARTNPDLIGLSNRNSLRRAFVRLATESGVSLANVIGTIAKLQLDERQTGIDLDPLVVQGLSEIDGCADIRHAHLLKAASLLRDGLLAASSLAHSRSQIEGNSPTLDIAERTRALTIANKRVDGAFVRKCITDAGPLTSTPAQELLAIQDYLQRDGSPATMSRMEAKMAVGQLTVMEVEQFKDDVRTLERTFLRWKEKHDFNEANDRLQHVQGLALQQCRSLHDDSLAPSGFRNPIVTDREALKAKLVSTASAEAQSLFGCRPEHLAGAVGMLTEDCRVWWSAPFDVDGQA